MTSVSALSTHVQKYKITDWYAQSHANDTSLMSCESIEHKTQVSEVKVEYS